MGVTTRTAGTLITRVWDAEASRGLAQSAIKAIDVRTFDRGLDVEDRAFEPYAPATVERLRATGQPTRVDLNSSGRLRAAVAQSVAQADARGVRLALPDGVRAQAAGVSVKRPFWGLSPRDVERLQEAIGEIVAGAVRRGAVAVR